ncbi:MAG: chromosome segregation protein SMC, partial [Deltaproteobacteria bacterium]
MKLKKIELYGFKSYVSRTPFRLPSGVTAIVGPNGCGKSNVVDAIRWAFGEMSVKTLRGGEMMDVIFNGSQALEPAKMAKVSLTFEAEEGEEPPWKAFCDGPEITITRKISRNGERGYLINGNPCRMRDITAIFHGTGLAQRNGYAIIQQGQVERLITAKPTERRIVVEEAAGITGYKEQRQQALRRIESVEQDFEQLRMIMREKKRQMNALERQAKRARKYRELKERRRELDLKQARYERSIYDRQIQRSEAEILTLRHKITRLTERLKHLDAQHLEQRQKNRGASQELTELREEIVETDRKIQDERHRIDTIEREIKTLSEQFARHTGEEENFSRKDEQLRAEIEGVCAQQAACEAEVEENREAIEIAEEELRELLAMKESLTARSEADQKARYAAEARLQSAHDRRAELVKRFHEIEELLARIAAEEETLARRVEEIESAQNAMEEQVAAQEAEKCRLERELFEEDERSVALAEELEACELGYNRLREKWKIDEIRLLSLEERLGGEMSDALQQMVTAGGIGEIRFHGILADRLVVERAFETAIESILADRLEGILVDDLDAGITACQRLRELEAGGQATFIPRNVEASVSSPLPTPEGAQPLVECLSVAEGDRCLLAHLLRDTFLVPDLETARQIVHENGFQGTLVTPAGEILDPWGCAKGGSPRQGSGILEKKREMRELSEQIERLREELGRREEERSALRDRLSAAEARVEELKALHRQAEMVLLNHTKDLERIRHDREQIEPHRQRLRHELQRAQTAKSELEGEISSIDRTIEESQAEILRFAQTLENFESASSDLEARIEALSDELTERKVQGAAGQERIEALSRRKLELEEARVELHRQAARLKEEIADHSTRIATLEENRKHHLANLEALLSMRAALSVRHSELEATHKGDLEAISALEAEIAHTSELLDRSKEAVQKEALTHNTATLKRQNLLDTILEKYQLELEASPLDVELPAITEEEKEELREITKTLENFGEVNPLALDEFETVKHDYDELEAQKADLTKSIHDLR